MKEIVKNIIGAIPWVFSGIGVFLISIFIKKTIEKKNEQKQKIKNHSIGIQAGNNIHIEKDIKNE